MKGFVKRIVRQLCRIGIHGETEDRVLKTYEVGIKVLAPHCKRCNKCYIDLTPEIRKALHL